MAVNTNKFTVAATTGNTLVAGTLGVTGATTLSSTLGVTGATTLSSTLGVTGTSTLAGVVATTGSFTTLAASSTLAVTGATTLSSTLSAGASTLNSLTVTNAATLSSTLGVAGAATLSSSLAVTGAATFNGNLISSGSTVAAAEYFRITDGDVSPVTKFLVDSSNGNTSISGTLGVTGLSTLNSLSVTNAATIGTTLGVTGASTLNSLSVTNAATIGTTLGVTGTSTLAAVVATTGSFTTLAASSTLAVTGATTLSSTLGVAGDVAVNTNKFNIVAASGNTTIAGTLAVTSSISGSSVSATGVVSGSTLTSTVASGTAPLTITSTTKVPNLNADRVDDISFTTTSLVTGGIPYISSTAANNHVVSFIEAGTTNTILQSTAGGAPIWVSPSGFSAGSSTSATHLNGNINGDTFYQNVITTNLTTTISSSTSTVSSATGILPGMLIYNSNVPGGTKVDSIVGTTVTMSNPATATGTAVSSSFAETKRLAIGTANTVLTSSGTATQWSNSLTLGGTLGVTGATTLSSTLGVTGATILSSTLSAGASTLNSLTVTNAASVGSTFSAGASTLNSLTVTNAASVGTTLGVTGATTLSSTLSAGASTLNSLGVTNAATVGGTLGVTGVTTLSSTLTHGGLTPSAGTNVDQLYTATDSALVVTTAWVDTSVNATELTNGSYMVQVSTGAGATLEFHTGVMSWFSGDANTASGDEIVLHRASAGTDASNLFLRVYRSAVTTTDMVLQISASSSRASAAYTYKFRRMM